MAQLVEHILGKDEVPSSNLGSSSKTNGIPFGVPFLVLELLPIRFELSRRIGEMFEFEPEGKRLNKRFVKGLRHSAVINVTARQARRRRSELATDARQLCDWRGVAALATRKWRVA